MATQVEVCNRALTRAGALRIMDVAENTKSGRAIAAIYNGVRDSCLSMANWRFAFERAELQATTAQDGFTYAYFIPASWLRLVKIRDRFVGAPTLGARYVSDPLEEFVIEQNRTLLTNYAPPLKCLGVKKIEDVSQYDPLFVDYFVLCMTVEIWDDVSRKSATKLQTIMSERDSALVIARNNNAIQEAPQEIDDTSWLLSRVGP